MDLLAVVTLGVAGAGFLISVLAWHTARDARNMAVGARKRATHHGDVDAKLTHPTPERSDPAGEARTNTPHTENGDPPVLETLDDDRTATLVVRRGDTPGQALPTNQGSGSGLIGLFVTNDGPAVAHNVRLLAAFPNGTIRSSDPQGALAARKEAILFAQVVPQDFGSENTVAIAFRVTYQDGHGDRELAQGVRIEGGWKGPWKTFFSGDAPWEDAEPDPVDTGRGRTPTRRRR